MNEGVEADLCTVDRLVPHVSTIPAIAGQAAHLFLREKILYSLLSAGPEGPRGAPVALMIHGGYAPAILAFDAPRRGYSWMEFLARAGVDAFAMDMSGYGRSIRPAMMDDPCNLAPAQQAQAGLAGGETRRGPSYPYELVNSDSEADDIDRVVDFIRALRGVDKLTLLGWSGGGVRAGAYAVRHPEKVERLVIFASSNYRRNGPSERPSVIPKPGAAVSFQTRDVGEGRRWLGSARYMDMIEPDMPSLIWNLGLTLDLVGAAWGSGGLRAPTRTYWGWNAQAAAKLALPTLIMVGEQDGLIDTNLELYEDLGARRKIFLAIACGTHFMGWEKQSRVLHRASLEWIKSGELEGRENGRFRADEHGTLSEKS